MKKSNSFSVRSALALGTLAVLFALPQSASAQLLGGGYMRSGAVVQGQPVPQRPVPVQPSIPMMMRPGPVRQGSYPTYSQAPIQSRPVYNGTATYDHAPVYVPPAYSQNSGQNGYGNYNNGYGNYNNGYGNYNNGYGNYNNGSGSNRYNNNNSYGNGYYPSNGPALTIPSGQYYPTGGALPGRAFTPPVGPANGAFFGQAPITSSGPALLGGYYYGNYCNDGGGRHEYRSVYSNYGGFPQYIYSPNIIVVGNDYPPEYTTPSLPFATPVYQTTYNQNDYYVATPERVDQLQAGGAQAKAALEHAYPANSFQAAFADIAHAWTDNDIDLVRKHLRNNETRVSVFLDGKYSYSIASSDFSQITRDALDKLHTVSFTFTRIRKAKNGDVTAFGSHVYRASDAGNGMDSSGTVPFDQASDDSTDSSTAKTIYVSYTLRRYGTEWDIVATDSANHDLAASSYKVGE